MNQIKIQNSFLNLTSYINSLLNLSPKEIITLSLGNKINYFENHSMMEVELQDVTVTCLFENGKCRSSLLFGDEDFFSDYIQFCKIYLSQSQVGKNTWFHHASLITAHEAKDIPVVIFTLNPFSILKN